jgi:hypothetical protein
MRFPHIAWAAAERRMPHYKLAAMVVCSEARLSRCLSGRTEFTPDERTAIARALGFPESWLFEEVAPPLCPAAAHGDKAGKS